MSTIKERFDELMDDFSGRIKNPLILSFLLVWSYYHWELIYIVLRIGQFDVYDGWFTIKEYIRDNGWCKMIGLPLGVAFISLGAYYLIAIGAQLIKVYIGKKWRAKALSQIDEGNFVPKEELTREKKHSKILKEDRDKLETENRALIAFKNDAETKINEYYRKNNEVTNNINYNLHLKAHLESIIIILSGRLFNVDNENIKRSNINTDAIKMLNGTWDINISDGISRTGGVHRTYIIDNVNVTDVNDAKIGSIENFKFDSQIQSINFTIILENNYKVEEYRLIKIDSHGMIGFSSKDVVYFDRRG
jgi:hypothetical protein